MRRLVIDAADAGQRLDRFLRKAWPEATLGHIYKALRRGAVLVNDARSAPSHRLVPGDVLTLRQGAEHEVGLAPRPPATAGRAGDVVVVHRDAHILVADKPAGLALHPGTGVRDHLLGRVQGLVGAGAGVTFRVAPAHRLDRDTSGLVAFGISPRGLRGLAAALREGRVDKRYLARVHGEVLAAGVIDLPLAVSDRQQGPKVVADATGRPARTGLVPLGGDGATTLLEITLDTGRTHQIRAHLAAAGHPLVGDRRYGRADGARRLMLHAWRLTFAHPVDGRPLRLEAPPPPELAPPRRERSR